MEHDMPRPVFETLGVYGLNRLEPILLAALAGESTLLLIGEHGSGKSMLLERIATALELRWRHYNTSLLSFDDLVGYPVPDAEGNLKFVKTPAAIWGAQAVFFDEISRARPDLQNKLFPIIHERRVQGIDLEGLAYRWAAMNPPSVDGEGDYIGSEPLDLALADRFAFHVTIPAWRSLPESVQKRILSDSTQPTPLPELQERLAIIKNAAAAVHASLGDQIADYTVRMAAAMASTGRLVSARRAVIISRNIALVHASLHASLQTDDACSVRSQSLADSSWLALCNSLPFSASALPLDAIKLLALHREIAIIAYASGDDSRAYVLQERDPVKRIGLTLKLDALEYEERGALIMDAVTQLNSDAQGATGACGWWIVSQGMHEALPPAVAEELALLYREAAIPTRLHARVSAQTDAGKAYIKFEQLQKEAKVDDPAEVALIHFLSSRLQSRAIGTVKEIEKAVADWWQALKKLVPQTEDANV